MAFIRVQNLKLDSGGRVQSGSASIVDTCYVSGAAYHSRQVVRESLGRVIWLAADRRSGVFLSQRRGLVSYDADSDSFTFVDPQDERCAGQECGTCAGEPVLFGEVYWLLLHMRACGLLEALASAFPDQLLRCRLVCHVLHRVLGADMDAATFFSTTMASALFPFIEPASLRCDTLCLLSLDKEECARSFFRAWAGQLRERRTSPGEAVLLDMAGLPWASANLLPGPFDPPQSACGQPEGLTLVCDAATMDPLWFGMHGDRADAAVLHSAAQTARELSGLSASTWILDGSWLSKDLVRELCVDSQIRVTALVPPRRDFEPKELFREHVRPYLGRSRHEFSCYGRTYFGRRTAVSLFGREFALYCCVDRERAARGAAEFTRRHPGEQDDLGGFKKDWLATRYGFFALLSSTAAEPREVLEQVLGCVRVRDNLVFPPADRFSSTASDSGSRVRCRLLLNSMAAIVRQGAAGRARGGGMSLSRLLSLLRPLHGQLNNAGIMLVGTPDEGIRTCFALLDAAVPAHLNLSAFREALGLEPPNCVHWGGREQSV